MGGGPSIPKLSHSFKDRQDALKKSITGAFASQVVKKSMDVNFTAISFAGVNCNTKLTQDCRNCLQKYYSDKWLDNPANKSKVQDLMETSKCKESCIDQCRECLITNLPRSVDIMSDDPEILKYKQTFCRGVCTCSISNINNSSHITLNSIVKQQVQNVDINAIAKQVLQDMKDKYGSTGTMNDSNLISLLVTIKSDMVTRVEQTLHSTQALVIDGPGVDLSGVIQDVVIDATMQAITATCSENASDPNNPGFTQPSSPGDLPPPAAKGCNVDMFNQLVNQQMKSIVDSVDDNVKFNIKTVWNSTKRYLIITGAFLLAIVIIIVVLLIRNALRKAT